MPNPRGIQDNALWQQEIVRQFLAVKAALKSLKLQVEQRQAKHTRPTKSMREMAPYIEAINAAYTELFIEIKPDDPLGIYSVDSPQGRREFLADLKGEDR